MPPSPPSSEPSPFGGGPARHVLSLPAAHVAELYRQRCGLDVREEFGDAETLRLYECERTGYRFWRPRELAGSAQLYARLCQAIPGYYREDRWEYALARSYLGSGDRILEIGCGRGYFLASAEGLVAGGLGLEFNPEALANKVTREPIRATPVEDLARAGERFQSVWSFQVLEHIPEPDAFLRACLECLAPGGLLGLSTPNLDYPPFARREDALDLPPHHVGHFREEVYRRLATFYGLELVQVHREPRRYQPEPATERTLRSVPYRLARRLGTRLFNAAYRWSGEPGPSLLTVYRKPR